MSKEIKRRGGTSVEHDSFIGASKEITVDTTNNTLRVHDSVTPGGHKIDPYGNRLTTLDLVNGTIKGFPAGEVILTPGFHSSGDGGGAKWRKTGLTGAPSQTPAQLLDSKLRDSDGNEWELVVDGPVNLKAMGVISGVVSTAEFNAAISSGEVVLIDVNTDLIIDPNAISWANATTLLIYGIVNGSPDCVDIRGGIKLIFNTDRNRQVIRTVDFEVRGYENEKAAKAGSALRVDGTQEIGGSMVYLNSNDSAPLISPENYVLLHTVQYQSANVPEVWGYNPVLTKLAKSDESVTGNTKVYGVEVSLSNETDETGNNPLGNNAVTGFFASYVSLTGEASAAYTCGGLISAWKTGLYIDGITAAGTGIRLVDDVTPNSGMAVGLDLSPVSAYAAGAILLGNGHQITGKTTTDQFKSLLKVNANDEVELGSTDTNARLQYNQLAITSAGVGGLGVNPVNYDASLFVVVNGVQYKIALIAV